MDLDHTCRMAKNPAVTADLALSMVRHYAGAQSLHSPLLSAIHGDLSGLVNAIFAGRWPNSSPAITCDEVLFRVNRVDRQPQTFWDIRL
jgi:hypothetical protein